MKKALAISCVAVCVLANGWGAVERVWTGGGNGALWGSGPNWSGGQMPLAGDVAVFSGVAGTITVDVSTPALAGMRVTSGALELVPVNENIRLNGTADCVFEIGAGAVLTNSVYSQFPVDATAVKAGAGALILNRGFRMSGDNNMTFDIAGGLVRLLVGVGDDGMNMGRGSVIVKDGATLHVTANNRIANRTVIDVREGGVFDGTGCGGDVIGAIIGNGTLTSVNASMTLPDGKTYQFDGTILPTGATLTLGSVDPAFSAGVGRYRIADAQNHANASLIISTTNVLTFAAGIGEARVKRITGRAQTPLFSQTLEDEAGAPVQLVVGTTASYDDTASLLLEGPGGLTMTNYNQTVTTEQPYYGPTVVDSNARFYLGNDAVAGSIPNSAYLRVNANGTFAPRPPAGFLLWDKPTFGNGHIELTRNGTDFELGNLCLTNGTVRIGSATSTNRVTLAGGRTANSRFDFDYASGIEIAGGHWENTEFWRNATNGVFTVSGGTVSGGMYRTYSPTSSIVRLTGGHSTNVYLYLNNNSGVEITGGSHFFRSALAQDSHNAIYRQSGGTSGFTRSDAHNNTNDVFLIMTGGTMYNTGDGGGHFRGIGATLSNDARFIQTDTIEARVASDGHSHTVRLLDQSYMELHQMRMMSSGGTGSCGRVYLQDNATLALRRDINVECNPNNTAHLHFNGGTVRMLPPGGWSWANNDYAWYWIEEGGLNLSIEGNSTLSLHAKLRDGTVAGGGFRKSGIGTLSFNADQYYTGTTFLRDGKAQINRLGQTFFGAGGNEIRLQGAQLEFWMGGTSGTDAESAPLGNAGTLAYEYGNASLILNRGQYSSLAITFPSFTRAGHGTLLLYTTGNSAALGTTDNFKLSAAPAQINGILCPSVAAFSNSDNPKAVDFLSRDASDGILRRATYGSLGDGPATVARAAAAQTLNDTHVHALNLTAATLTLNAGQTLTLGDGATPAGLILNNISSARATITGGTLNFGGSEGIIWNSERRATAEGGLISSTITGTQGITLRGINNNSFCEFTSANTYSGGTRVHTGTLSVNGSDRLGSGDVWVYGSRLESGGSLRISATATIPNNLHLLGTGHGNSLGALRCEANATFAGSVEVTDLARISTGAGSFTATLAGGVYGSGTLDVAAGPGRLRLTAPATHTGGTLINAGILEIAEGGTLGGGSVSNNATLVFSNTSNIIVTNDILGAGAILLTGSGTVTFTGKTTCTILAGVSSTLQDGAYTFGNLGGTGTLYAADAQLTVGDAGADAYYAGTLTGGIALDKTGPGILTLAGNNQNTGTLSIRQGTVRLGGLPSIPADGLVYQLDAQNDDTVIRDGTGTVTDWLDATPNGFDFTETLPVNRPLYRADGINGLPAVYFGGWTNRLAAQASANVQNVFAVTQQESANIKNMGGLWGRSGFDSGLRVQGATWQIGGGFNDNGQTYVNGILQNAFTPNTPFLVSASSDRAQNWATAIGDYWGTPSVSGSPRSYAGNIGEVLVYGHTLNDATRLMLEMHLSAKWRLGLYPAPATTGILSPASGLAIGQDGTLDLNGSAETITTLTGAGAIINSADAPATLTVGSGDFSGAIGGGVTLAVDTGTLTLRGDRALDALELRPGATVDLAGATLTVSRLSGTGSIINGMVIVTGSIAPVGTLELPATVATGCTLEIALRATTCGTLHVNGDFDLTTVNLAVTVAETLKVLDYTLLTCTGQITGTAFASATLPPRATLRHTPQSVGLFYENGTRIILR